MLFWCHGLFDGQTNITSKLCFKITFLLSIQVTRFLEPNSLLSDKTVEGDIRARYNPLHIHNPRARNRRARNNPSPTTISGFILPDEYLA